MQSLAEIAPRIRMAHPYRYTGNVAEGTRTSGLFAFHLFDGPGSMIVNQSTYKLERNSLIFIRPYEVHSFHLLHGQHLQSHNIYCFFGDHPHLESPTSIFNYGQGIDLAQSDTASAIYPELEQLPTHCSLSNFTELAELFIHIVRLSEGAKHFVTEMTEALFKGWMLQWYDATLSPTATDRRIVKITREMEDQPESRLSYEQWCARSGLEKTYFYKLFNRETGMTPKQYLLRVKMKKAAALLLETRQSVTAISQLLGYDSVHYFSKQFKSYYAMSPIQYRMRI